MAHLSPGATPKHPRTLAGVSSCHWSEPCETQQWFKIMYGCWGGWWRSEPEPGSSSTACLMTTPCSETLLQPFGLQNVLAEIVTQSTCLALAVPTPLHAVHFWSLSSPNPSTQTEDWFRVHILPCLVSASQRRVLLTTLFSHQQSHQSDVISRLLPHCRRLGWLAGPPTWPKLCRLVVCSLKYAETRVAALVSTKDLFLFVRGTDANTMRTLLLLWMEQLKISFRTRSSFSSSLRLCRHLLVSRRKTSGPD